MNPFEKSESIKASLRQGFQDGSSKMAKRKCYGYTAGPGGGLEINPDEAQVIRWIFERYLAGDSLGKIAAGLERQGIPSPTGKPKWNREAIDKLLSNEKYIGRVLLQKTISRNRWCGAYWASKGIRVIPTVNWGDESTFDFCFEGIERGSVVAVSTYMASEHGNRSDQKKWFMAGYNEMLRRIEPEKIICYNTPFPEMQGDIIYVDYERSSWKFMNYERFDRHEDLDSFKIGGQSTAPHDIIAAFIDVPTVKGGGSAYEGEWKPFKPADEKFIGEPGEMKPSFTKKGDLYETHIGPNGKADYEIHHSDHGFPKYHEIPHRHEIYWDERGPHLGHDDLPLKQYRAGSVFVKMSSPVGVNTYEDDRFKSISDFKWCMKRGGEVQFEWKGISYCCFGCICPAPGQAPRMVIAQAGSVEVNTRTEKWCDTADELLDYMVGGDRLRDVITQVTVWDRTI